MVVEATRYVGEEEEVDVSHCGDDEGDQMFLRIGNQVSGNAHGEDTEEFSKSHAEPSVLGRNGRLAGVVQRIRVRVVFESPEEACQILANDEAGYLEENIDGELDESEGDFPSVGVVGVDETAYALVVEVNISDVEH